MGKRRSIMTSSTGLVEVIGLTEKFTFNPKEGIDNPAMVVTDADSPSPRGPRLCVLRRVEGESFGFHLRVVRGCRGHLIRNVVPGGVAARGGLRDGDRLLEVNNRYVDDAPHAAVARKIKLSGQQLCLLVLDEKEYQEAVARGQGLRGVAREHGGHKPPRLCHVTRDPVSGLGVSFTPLEGERGRFAASLVPGGAAERAGVRKGDRLVWMNGAAVSDLTHAALSRMMKKCDRITVLVIDGESERIHAKEGIPILPTAAVPHNMPRGARELRLIRGPGDYGFLLRLEKTPSGRTFHVLRDVGGGSPAERAGLRDGELLLEVNGESVESLKHEEIVDRVRLSGQKVSLTTITPQGLDFYTRLGLSPLLFCVDDGAEEREEEEEEESITTASAAGQPPRNRADDGDPQGPGAFVSQVTPGAPGQRAGLLAGDVVMEVNGQNVGDRYLEDVKEGGRRPSSRVMDEAGYNKCTPPNDTADSEQEEEDKYEISSL